MRDGFTLIEVTIALGILATGMLGMIGLQVEAMRGGRSGRHTSEAAGLARDRMEILHRLDWADAGMVDTSGWTTPVSVANAVQAAGSPTEQTYNVRWRITDTVPNLKAIDVQVSWDEPKRLGRAYAISSVRHDDP